MRRLGADRRRRPRRSSGTTPVPPPGPARRACLSSLPNRGRSAIAISTSTPPISHGKTISVKNDHVDAEDGEPDHAEQHDHRDRRDKQVRPATTIGGVTGPPRRSANCRAFSRYATRNDSRSCQRQRMLRLPALRSRSTRGSTRRLGTTATASRSVTSAVAHRGHRRARTRSMAVTARKFCGTGPPRRYPMSC